MLCGKGGGLFLNSIQVGANELCVSELAAENAFPLFTQVHVGAFVDQSWGCDKSHPHTLSRATGFLFRCYNSQMEIKIRLAPPFKRH